MNRLYYGDNLDVLRRHIEEESVDLVYLDPPFNSNASYNVLFAERDGTQAASQIKAFEDTWRWDESAALKAGKRHATHVRDLRGVVDREKAAIGVRIAMDEPTKPMRTARASKRHLQARAEG